MPNFIRDKTQIPVCACPNVHTSSVCFAIHRLTFLGVPTLSLNVARMNIFYELRKWFMNKANPKDELESSIKQAIPKPTTNQDKALCPGPMVKIKRLYLD